LLAQQGGASLALGSIDERRAMYITQALHRAVQQTPDRTMTICGRRRRTFAEVGDRVARLAAAFHDLGVQPGDRVAILALNSDRYLEYILAVPWADAVLNPINHRWSANEISYAIDDSDSRVLLVDDMFVPMVPRLRDAHPSLRSVVYVGDGPTPEGLLDYEELIADHDRVPDVRRGGDTLAGLFYTGGTTGHAKGVMLSHANLWASAVGTVASGYSFAPGGTYLHVAPMFHLADFAGSCGTMVLGNTHAFLPAFEPVSTMRAIEEWEVSETLIVPAMIQALADHPELPQHDLSSLRTIVFGASPIPQAVLERAMKAMPAASFVQAYGMTELAPVATLLPPSESAGDRLRSAGRAAPHAEVRIVDPLDNEVPRGTVGEVVCRGAHVMLGYWNKPEETAAAVRDGWMHTGDGAYMDDAGYIFIVDRLKDMIISKGENIYSVEVENAVAKHPAVAAVAVIGVPDEERGERVHAVVVLRAGAQEPALEELRRQAKESIAGYKAPRSVEFVDALPISGAGKVLKRELRQRYWRDSDRQVG
jgi:acyl-CoA synthetase (AMP-forming)/AMP-acid ligase II